MSYVRSGLFLASLIALCSLHQNTVRMTTYNHRRLPFPPLVSVRMAAFPGLLGVGRAPAPDKVGVRMPTGAFFGLKQGKKTLGKQVVPAKKI